MINKFNCNKYISSSFLDYPDNENLCVIFYMPGCNRKCEGCQNINLQEPTNYEQIDEIIEILEQYCKKEHTNKICLQGGDPLFDSNLPITRQILVKMGSNYDICIYTGASLAEVKTLNLTGFKYIKCGIFNKSKYIGSKKTDDYLQLATSNQELYDSNLNLLSKDGIYYF